MRRCRNMTVVFLFMILLAGGTVWAQIAVFPFEDLTRGAAGINMEVSSHVAEMLQEMGYQVIPPERIVNFLAANRLRWTGWSDRVTARKVENELKAQFILLGTVLEEDPERQIFGLCARILSAPNYRLVWGQTVAMSELSQISLLGLKKLAWNEMKEITLNEMLQSLPPDVGRSLSSAPTVGILQMYLHPRHARSAREITCGIKLDMSGDPPESLEFLIGKDKRIPAVKSEGYYTAAWKAPPVEGRYPVSLIARWGAPWMMEKRIFLTTFFVDNRPPKFTLKTSHGEHLSRGIAFRRHVRLVPVLDEGEPISRWRLEIISLDEKKTVAREVRQGHLPPAFIWRGTDRTGYLLPNGPYLARLTIWDLAGNESKAEVRLLLVRQLPEVTVEALDEEKTLEVVVTVGKHPVPLTDWRFEIWDKEGNLIVRKEGEGTPPAIKVPNKKGLRYTLELRDDFGNKLLLRNKKLKIVKAGAYGGKTKKLKRWINEF